MGALSFIQVAADSVGKKVRTYLGADGNHSETAVLVDTEGVQQATAAAPLRVDPTGTTTQPVSGSVSVSNLPAVQPVTEANQDASFVAPGALTPALAEVVAGSDGSNVRVLRTNFQGEPAVDQMSDLIQELRLLRGGVMFLVAEFGGDPDDLIQSMMEDDRAN